MKRGRQDSISDSRPDPKIPKKSKSARPSASSSSRSNPSSTAAPSSGPRSRWFEVVSPTDILPPGISSTLAAIEAVRVDLQPKQNEFPEQIRMKLPRQEGHHSFFAAPDGGQIAAMANEETQAGALANYIRFRPLIHWRVCQLISAPASSPKNLRAQDWRMLLGLAVLSTKNQDENPDKMTRSTKMRDGIIEVLQQNVLESGTTVRYRAI